MMLTHAIRCTMLVYLTMFYIFIAGNNIVTHKSNPPLKYSEATDSFNSRCNYFNWRASVASETLTGVTQLKIGDVCLFIYLDVRMSFCTLTLAYFCVSSVFDPVPSFTKQNPPV